MSAALMLMVRCTYGSGESAAVVHGCKRAVTQKCTAKGQGRGPSAQYELCVWAYC